MAGLIAAGSNDGAEYIGETRRLVLIEPQASAFARLEANFADADNATLIRTALGSGTGEAMMNTAHPDYSSSLLEPAEHLRILPAITFDGTERVTVRTLDDVMADVGGDFDAMVLDVQGYELDVLRGAKLTLRRLDWLKCEVNTAEVYRDCAKLDAVDDYLLGFGLRRAELDLYGGVWGDAIYRRDAGR